MTSMSDLTQDLVEEILSKVPITSFGAVRATCKGWNTFSKDRILCTREPKQQFLGFMMLDRRLCSMRFNLHGILNEDGEDLVGISMYDQVEISNVFYCAGLLLCVSVTRDKSSNLVVWNPYLGQIRLIDLKTETESTYALALGYDKNKNHKILRVFDNDQGYYEVYDLKSNSWRDFRVIPNWDIMCHRQGVSVNGNTYFWTTEDSDGDEAPDFLICFDFTEERFGKLLDLPLQPDYDDYDYFGDRGAVSCVREEKIAAVYHHCDALLSIIEIWVTTKIEPNAVSWIPFLKVDFEPLLDYVFRRTHDSFFIDEEKKLAVVFSSSRDDVPKRYQNAYIIGEDSYLKKVDLGEFKAYRSPLVCSSSYVPSLVQINQTAGPKKRENKKKRKKELSKNKEKKRKQNHAAIKV